MLFRLKYENPLHHLSKRWQWFHVKIAALNSKRIILERNGSTTKTYNNLLMGTKKLLQ